MLIVLSLDKQYGLADALEGSYREFLERQSEVLVLFYGIGDRFGTLECYAVQGPGPRDPDQGEAGQHDREVRARMLSPVICKDSADRGHKLVQNGVRMSPYGSLANETISTVFWPRLSVLFVIDLTAQRSHQFNERCTEFPPLCCRARRTRMRPPRKKLAKSEHLFT